MSILVIAAHPDDEILGCAGTLAKASKNHDIHILIMGEGITSRFDKKEAHKDKIEKLHLDVLNASKMLGVNEPSILNLPDNKFDTVPFLEIVKLVEKSIRQHRPKVIFTHSAGDLNIDHSIVHRAALTATRPMSDCFVKEIYAFEIPSSTEWSFNQFVSSFNPNYYVDITDTLEIKLKVCEIYETEIRPYPHPRSIEAVKALAHFRGSTAGLKAAEAYKVIRIIGKDFLSV